MTLGDLKDAGIMPSEYQIHMLEIAVSKECRSYGPNPHLFHCLPLSYNRVQRDLCWEVERLHDALRKMFPGIQLPQHLAPWKPSPKAPGTPLPSADSAALQDEKTSA